MKKPSPLSPPLSPEERAAVAYEAVARFIWVRLQRKAADGLHAKEHREIRLH